MKLLNVPPVKPGQKFKFVGGSSVYKVNSVYWHHVMQAWEVTVTLWVTANYRLLGSSVTFTIYSDESVEILND